MNHQGILVVVRFLRCRQRNFDERTVKGYDNYALSISATAQSSKRGRNRRKRILFVTKEQFEKMRDERKLIEYAQYVNNYYGTPKNM